MPLELTLYGMGTGAGSANKKSVVSGLWNERAGIQFSLQKAQRKISGTNGLKGRSPRNAAPNLEPGRITPIHWTMGEKSLLEIIIKDPSTPKQPVDLLNNDSEKDHD